MPQIHRTSRTRVELASLALFGLAMLTAGALFSIALSSAAACPFCMAQALTLGEELKAADAAVIAVSLAGPTKSSAPSSAGEEVERTPFKIVQVLKGESHLAGEKTIKTVYFGQAEKGTTFLLLGYDPRKLTWNSPIALPSGGDKYIDAVLKLPEKGPDRLAFFQKYLEHKDEFFARDAYDEFAKSPYKDVLALRKRMDHAQVVAWVKNADIPPSRRRLYLTMLSACGGKDDLPMLEEMLKSTDRKYKGALDATINCYLMLKGKDAMTLVEELYLKNKKADYADTYAAIMAVRIHAEEGGIVPKDRLLVGLRMVLDRPQLADLVIPDLARWEDWSAMPRLVELFKQSDEESSWVRVPVVHYLQACPKPEAKKYLDELAKIDPDSVKRANIFPQLAPPADATKKDNATKK